MRNCISSSKAGSGVRLGPLSHTQALFEILRSDKRRRTAAYPATGGRLEPRTRPRVR